MNSEHSMTLVQNYIQTTLEEEFPTKSERVVKYQRKDGFRGQDSKKRAPRTCQHCLQHGGDMAAMCKGRGPRGKCEYFDENGQRITHNHD